MHICCAPCSIYPYKELTENKTDSVVGFFYNPNIHPYTEYNLRKDSVEEYSKKTGLEVIFHKYDIENFFRQVSGHERFRERCQVCWRMRLEETAGYAAKNNFNFFTTTLLVSPYQDQDAIRQIGSDISAHSGVNFIYKDFRSGFRASQEEAKKEALYRQRYCGCVFSERERYEKFKTQSSKRKTTV